MVLSIPVKMLGTLVVRVGSECEVITSFDCRRLCELHGPLLLRGEEAPLNMIRAARFFAWLHHFRRLVIRWEYHVENFFGMVRLGCMQILFRYL